MRDLPFLFHLEPEAAAVNIFAGVECVKRSASWLCVGDFLYTVGSQNLPDVRELNDLLIDTSLSFQLLRLNTLSIL